MNGSHKSGFTIIEVILFLAISGLILVGMMAVSNNAINGQRYRDAVTSFVDYLQGQYDRVVNIRNDRSGAEGCVPGSISDTSRQHRGQSDCVIIGRLLTTSGSGTIVRSQTVYATNASNLESGSESEMLTNASLTTAEDSVAGSNEEYTLGWGTKLTNDFSMLIYRSSLDGRIRTLQVSRVTTLANLVALGSSDSFKACIDPVGLVGYPPMGAEILSGSSSASTVRQLNSGECT